MGASGPLVLLAIWLGAAGAVVGALTGVAMALRRTVVGCADGTFFPEGATDFRCFDHPQALLGTAVTAIAIAIGALVLLVAVALRAGMASATSAE